MSKVIRTLLIIAVGSILYVITYLLLRTGLNYLPALYLWKNANPILNIHGLEFSIADIFYFVFGSIVTVHGLINLFSITEENHSAQNMITRKTEKLITTGFYSKVRHPMYGTFVIIYLGMFLSIRSLWGVFIVLIIGIIQFFNTKLEEKRLIKTFGEEYRKYIQKVKSKLFIPIYRIYIVIGAIATILGLVQKGIR
ncbi:MAG: isoprenylcysteine carboxylmethyltransferase family protein [Kosmotoga sp.]|uniref:methyltransferase family protein n=1 Tax=Kosmotoga sp. TaxID=1955248 RepID=UPI001DD968F1|nr:isoprenylcysteine carboxylmethyltransferase family protein [Kosmotoga sp.]MBO8166666.1 isoprenylcysteine carboxylmethyltransferase family protein [Kosmotoga sp.]